MSIHLYLFLSLCQSKFTPVSCNPIFFISVYLHLSTCIYFHLFSIHHYLLFIQIYIYLFQSPSPNLSLSLIYWPISFSIFLPIQIHGYIFQCSFFFNRSLIYLPLSLSISCKFLCQSRFTLIYFNTCPSS